MKRNPTNSDDNAGPVVSLRDMVFSWEEGTPVLDIHGFDLEKGERLFLRGESGSGKSTLLGILGGVLTPSHGSVSVLGCDLPGLRGGDRDRFRADHLGIIFQMFNLLPYLSVLENVLLPCRFSRVRAERAQRDGGLAEEAERLLTALGLPRDYQDRPVTDLSVGQQQRVAAARALIGSPEIIFADEPTSALDVDRRTIFVELLMNECAANGTSLVFVSHDQSLSHLFDRALDLDDINHGAKVEGV